jgi:hypothetical protein
MAIQGGHAIKHELATRDASRSLLTFTPATSSAVTKRGRVRGIARPPSEKALRRMGKARSTDKQQSQQQSNGQGAREQLLQTKRARCFQALGHGRAQSRRPSRNSASLQISRHPRRPAWTGSWQEPTVPSRYKAELPRRSTAQSAF